MAKEMQSHTHTSDDAVSPPTAKPALRRACDCCRKRKVKCDGQEACGPCKKAGIRCAYLQPPKKKEKPKVKTPIPGTEWLRVTTTEGNIFYTHTVKKHSVWTVPEEIKDAVEALEKDEQEKAEQAAKAKVEEEARRAEEDDMELQQALEQSRQEHEARQAQEAQQSEPSGEAPADDAGTTGEDHLAPPPATSDAKPPPGKMSPKAQAMASHLERTGLCVICQDEEANIAIVDCGYVSCVRVAAIVL